jgi:hypothetical protein
MTVLPEMVALRNTRLMLDRLRDQGYDPGKIWLVLNRAGMAGGVPASEIEKRLGLGLAHHVPHDQRLATYSINRGVPLVISHRRSAMARAVGQLARALSETNLSGQPGATQKAKERSFKPKRERPIMKHLLSLVLFVVGVALFLFIGFVSSEWLFAALLGGFFVLIGLIFFRRGR